MLAMTQVAQDAANVLLGNVPWMWKNLVLALVPVLLAVWLFHGPGPGHRRTPAWWAGLVAFLAFLPNAPYVMTDVIHLYHDVRNVESDAVLSLAVIPQYALFMGSGVVAYTACLLLVERYVGRRRSLWLIPVLHALCAFGIFLGRSARLNSWDLVAAPGRVAQTLLDAVTVRNGVVVLTVFCVLFLAHDVAKRLWLARRVLLRGAPH